MCGIPKSVRRITAEKWSCERNTVVVAFVVVLAEAVTASPAVAAITVAAHASFHASRMCLLVRGVEHDCPTLSSGTVPEHQGCPGNNIPDVSTGRPSTGIRTGVTPTR